MNPGRNHNSPCFHGPVIATVKPFRPSNGVYGVGPSGAVP